jgi:two-component system sensor histidine kinase UhpB
MRSNPSDEIGEIRAELFTLVALLLAVWLATVALIRVAVTRGLRPLHLLGTAFDRMEHGETVSIPPVAVAELQRICGQFNRLAAALAQASADNRHLIERLMSAQEAERRELARELHDEIGPLLFGMRADAACILRWSAEGSLSNIPARALSLANHAQELQRINGRMLERMRPLVLEEMGLAEALRVLVASWRASLPDIDWVLTVPGTLAEPDRDTALTVFRIVQEALTNAARHSEAHRVEVILAERRDTLELSVRDDGRGLPERARSAAERRGYGLLGMAERVRQAGGAFSARNAPEGGTLIEARLPVPEAATCAFC